MGGGEGLKGARFFHQPSILAADHSAALDLAESFHGPTTGSVRGSRPCADSAPWAAAAHDPPSLLSSLKEESGAASCRRYQELAPSFYG